MAKKKAIPPADPNKTYIAHDGERIHYICTVDEATAQALRDTGMQLLEGECDDAVNYIVNGQVTPRPEMQATAEGLTIYGLPQPCTLEINGQRHECDDGTAELEFDQPGTYTVLAVAWPYLEKEFTLEN